MASDIPEIMDYVAQKSDGRGYFTIKAEPGTREADLTGVTVDSLDILVNTNDADLSNYSFKLDNPQSNEAQTTLNLVVKETSTGLYAYIIKYRTDANYLANHPEGLDWTNYTGDIIVYKTDGTFLSKQSFENATQTVWEGRDPCQNNGGGGGSFSSWAGRR